MLPRTAWHRFGQGPLAANPPASRQGPERRRSGRRFPVQGPLDPVPLRRHGSTPTGLPPSPPLRVGAGVFLRWCRGAGPSRDPLPRREGRPRGEGREFRLAPRRRRPGGAGAALRAGRGGRAGLPRHRRLPREPRHHPRRGVPHRGGAVHSAHRGRRRPEHRGHPPAAAGRRGQGEHQQRRGGRAGAGVPRGGGASAASASWWRWTRAGRGPAGGRCSPMAAAARPGSTRWNGRGAWRGPGRGRSC